MRDTVEERESRRSLPARAVGAGRDGVLGLRDASGLTQWVLGLAAPAAVAVVWGLFVSPKAKIELPRPAQFAIELAVFAAAALALAAADQPVLGIVLAVVALVSGTLNYVWRDD